jgi:predicted site-specific integrase-resolvase
MKLSQWAKQHGVCYKTAYNMYKNGMIPNTYQLPTGTILIKEIPTPKENKVAIYSRVSSSENKNNLDKQAERLYNYCIAKGYQVDKIVKEIASGLNDQRPKLEALLLDQSITIVVVEHKDRLARFGFNYIEKMLNQQNRKIEVINLAENAEQDLMNDFVAIITSFATRLYGKRRSKRKTELLIKELQNDTIDKNNT